MFTITIATTNNGEVGISFSFNGTTRKDSADIDFIVDTAKELKKTVEKLQHARFLSMLE